VHWLDITILVVVAVMALIGVHRGFLLSAINLVGNLAAIILAIAFAQPAAALMNTMFKLNDVFGASFRSILADAGIPNAPLESAVGAGDIISAAGADISAIMKTVLNQIFHGVQIPAGTNPAEYLGAGLGAFAVLILSAFMIFILIKIILVVLKKFIKNLKEIRLFDKIDRTGGLIFGLIQGALFVATFCVIMTLGRYIPFLTAPIDALLGATVIAQYAEIATAHVINWIIESGILTEALRALTSVL